MQRSPQLDALRGIAVIAVFVYHLASANLIAPITESTWPYFGMFGVDLFYVLSGYFITLSVICSAHWSPWLFLKARVTRIYPAYIASIIVILTVRAISESIHLDHHFLIGLVAHALMLHNFFPGFAGQINGVYWTLGVEFPYYLLMLALAPFLRATQFRWKTLGLMLMYALVWRATVFATISGDLPDANGRFFMATQLPGTLDAFAIGGVCSLLVVDYRTTLCKYGPALLSIGIVGLGAALWFVERHAEHYWRFWLTAIFWRTWLSIAIGVILLGFLSFPGKNIFALGGLPWIGTLSFSVYLYHFPIIHGVLKLFPNQPLTLQLAIIAIATTGISWASWRYVETLGHNFKNTPRNPI